MNRLRLIPAMVVAVLCSITATAQPKIHQFSFSDGSIVQRLSNNGQWGVAQPSYDDAIESSIPRLINLATDEFVELQTQADVVASGACRVKDVTDDGNIVVGSYKSQPAYWTKSTGKWTTVDVASGCSGGTILAVTPDGKYAVGSCSYATNEYQEKGAMWDLATGKIIDLPNTPVKDMTHETQNQMRFTDISPDGRHIVMYMSFSYILPASLCTWVYDRNTSTAKAIGFAVSDTEPWTPKVENLYFVEEPNMSPNGKWVAVNTSVIYDDNSAAYEYPARYNVESDLLEIYSGAESDGMLAGTIDNNGCLYGASPKATPLRNWSVYNDNYWFDINSILTQNYNYSITGKTGFENTGTVHSISDDGKRIAVMCDPQAGEGYVIDLPETVTTLSKTVNLLGEYTITPAQSTTFSMINKVNVLFNRNIEVVGNYKDVVLKNLTTGETVRSASGLSVDVSDPQQLLVTFRSTPLNENNKYSVEIPAGIVSVAGDKERTNSAITITYNGRANKAVEAKTIYPADGSELARIDNNTSNITITFDTDLALSADASAELLNLSDNSKTALNLLVVDNKLAVYPSSTAYLYKDLQYKVTINAGAVTDLAGNGGNAEIVINYTGTYEPTISMNDENVFIETFDDQSAALNNFMRYEGDHLTPTDEMKAWGFDADNQPWNFSVRDSETSTNYCAASHSTYNPAGQSDDWMSTPQLYLPDNYCYLSFKAQNYKNRKEDYLKVVILETDSTMYTLNAKAIEKFKAEGKVVFNERLTIGADGSEALDKGWTDYRVDLSAYGNKKIYVAFLNDNNDQSAIFVDSVVVKRNLKFLVGLQHLSAVVNKESTEIKGRVTANDDAATFNTVKVELYDTDGSKVDEFSQTGLSLTKGQYVDFTFSKPLPLKVAAENEFTLKVTLDDHSSEAKGTVKNLSYQTTKRVVLEEMTGTTCVNCPRGILAIQNLEKLYHDQFIPLSLHTYTGDNLNTGQDGYCQFLGLNAAPSGIVQRNGIISSPMGYDYGLFQTVFADGYNCWQDHVAKELETPADADINATVTVDEKNNTYSVPVTVKYALNAKNLNLNLFLVILEDGIIGSQSSNVGGETEAIFGEWGAGGRYSASTNYNVTHNDVVRSTMSSYNGFGGYLPQTMEAGTEYEATLGAYEIPEVIYDVNKLKAVVMLIDANDGTLINAVCAKFPGYETGINDVQANKATHTIGYANGNVTVSGEGNANVQVYSLSGTLLGNGQGSGMVSVPVSSWNNAVIVKVTSDGKTTIKKMFVR